MKIFIFISFACSAKISNLAKINSKLSELDSQIAEAKIPPVDENGLFHLQQTRDKLFQYSVKFKEYLHAKHTMIMEYMSDVEKRGYPADCKTSDPKKRSYILHNYKSISKIKKNIKKEMKAARRKILFKREILEQRNAQKLDPLDPIVLGPYLQDEALNIQDIGLKIFVHNFESKKKDLNNPYSPLKVLDRLDLEKEKIFGEKNTEKILELFAKIKQMHSDIFALDAECSRFDKDIASKVHTIRKLDTMSNKLSGLQCDNIQDSDQKLVDYIKYLERIRIQNLKKFESKTIDDASSISAVIQIAFIGIFAAFSFILVYSGFKYYRC